MTEKRVVIDIGHGFYDETLSIIDYGASTVGIAPDLQEFHLNMISAISCQITLQALGHRCSFVPFGLTRSARGSHAKEADVFLSIHHNASDLHHAQGTEVLVQKSTSIPADRLLALRIAKTVAAALGIGARGVMERNIEVLKAARKTNAKAVILTEAFFLDSAGVQSWSYARLSGVAIAQEIDLWFKDGN